MKKASLTITMSLVVCLGFGTAFGADAPVSEATQECLDCHSVFHPGIVADWQKSRHARFTPQAAMAAEELQRRVSSSNIPEALQGTSVGCAECHTLRGEAHADTFEHNGYDIHVVVSPDDCATCHSTEREQYSQNIMAMAEKNLSENKLYADLQRTILGKAEARPKTPPMINTRFVFSGLNPFTIISGMVKAIKPPRMEKNMRVVVREVRSS